MDSQSNGLSKFLPKSIHQAVNVNLKHRRNKGDMRSLLPDDDGLQPSWSWRLRRSTARSRSDTDMDTHSLPADEAEAAHSPDSSSSASQSSTSTRPTSLPPGPNPSASSTTTSSTSARPPRAAVNTETPRALAQSSTLARHASDSPDSGPTLDRSRTTLGQPELGKKRSSSSTRLRDVFKPKKGDKSDEKRSDPPAAGPIGDHPPPAARTRDPPRAQQLELRPAPGTPPALGEAQPVIVNTPPTPTEPSVPRILTDGPRRPADIAISGDIMSQRRRAGSNAGPVKLAAAAPPLSPTPENPPASPNPAATFFSSMFSAVQNTATSLSTSIPALTQGQVKGKGQQTKETHLPSDSVEVESVATARPSTEPKEPAVKTLGLGDLSLSQLGIVDPPSVAPSPVTSRFAEAETRTRSESAPADPRAAMESHEDPGSARPRSIHEAGDTTIQVPGSDDKSGIGRSGSIRSAIQRRHRGSSITTHTTAATSAVEKTNSNQAPAPGPKLTGFAVANKKRNRDFHNLFKSVPDDDYLIEDYSCALQREILAHGRLYISEGHLCFSSNILGWVTTLVLSFDEIVSVEKRSTALVFKNGLEISTLHAKHIFASFASRDTTYDLIIKIWKLGHPHLQSTLNGVRLEEPGGDRTEKIVDAEAASAAGSAHSASGSEESDDGEEDDDVYDEDEDDAAAQPAAALDVQASDSAEKVATTRKVSGSVPATEKKAEDGAPAAGDFPGPATHAPTDCGDSATHFEKVLADDVIPAPLGKIYDMLFGPSSAVWMGKWLTTDQKCFDLQMEDKRGLTDEVRQRNYTYIKPLTASIGPKQTKCIVSEQVEQLDLEKAVTIVVSTQNPDVPSGNIFVVKTKYCLTWAENNGTRIQVNNVIEWSGKSWIKGAIERGVNEGQGQYCKDLFAALKAAVSSRARAGTGTGGRKKRPRKQPSALASGAASDAEGTAPVLAQQNWGLFEPLRPFLSPIASAIRPILTGNVVYGLLVGLIVASWFGFGSRPQYYHGGPPVVPAYYADAPARLAAYEELWRGEESDLWAWLEERAGLDRVVGVTGDGPSMPPRRKSVDPRTLEERLREARMDERELREAIRVTEEHLEVLKAVIDRRAGGGAPAP